MCRGLTLDLGHVYTFIQGFVNPFCVMFRHNATVCDGGSLTHSPTQTQPIFSISTSKKTEQAGRRLGSHAAKL